MLCGGISCQKHTLHGTNISHLGKRKIFQHTLGRNMLVPGGGYEFVQTNSAYVNFVKASNMSQLGHEFRHPAPPEKNMPINFPLLNIAKYIATWHWREVSPFCDKWTHKISITRFWEIQLDFGWETLYPKVSEGCLIARMSPLQVIFGTVDGRHPAPVSW